METANKMATSVENRAPGPSERPRQVRLGPVAFSGFPVRNLTRQLTGTGGEWISAYQTEQKKRLRAVLSTSARETKSAGTINPPANTREVSGAPKKILDGFFLLKHCYVEDPSDLCVCNISGAGLKNYKEEDFALFDNVIYINAAENQLPLEAFKTFSVLQELELSLNSLVDVSIEHKDFFRLQCLDLSYNSLSGMALLSLGTLPNLKELHLTGNNIVALPVEMSRPYSLPGQDAESAFKVRFPVLERLWLDDNKFTDQATFATLAGLRKLKYLNLDNNEIYTVPHLKLIGTSPLKRNTKIGRRKREKSDPQPYRTEEQPAKDFAPTSEQSLCTGTLDHDNATESIPYNPTLKPDPTSSTPTHEHILTPRDHSPIDTDDRGSQPLVQTPREFTPVASVHTPEGRGSTEELTLSMAPFPELGTLSLVNNLILTAEGLLSCCTWPALKELIIHGNPLTRASKGMPPLLQTHLVEQCGISVVRHKPSSRRMYYIGKAAKEFKKVSTAPPPTIPKHPLPALEPPPHTQFPMLEYSPSTHHTSPSHSESQGSSANASGEEGEGQGEREGESDPQPEGRVPKQSPGQHGVFLTQVVGEQEEASPAKPEEKRAPSPLQKPWSARNDFRARRKELREKYRDVPDRYKGYEALLDTYEDPSMPVPSDVHSCTRALQYALKHPLVVTESKPSPSPKNYLKRKPSAVFPKPHTSSRIRDMQQILDDMRNRCVALETNLGETLHPKTPPQRKSVSQLQKESQQLLAEMQARYDKVRTSSLRLLRSLSEQSVHGASPRGTPTRVRKWSTQRSPLWSRESDRTGTPPSY